MVDIARFKLSTVTLSVFCHFLSKTKAKELFWSITIQGRQSME